MKKYFTMPKIEAIMFTTEDIITASGIPELPEQEWD